MRLKDYQEEAVRELVEKTVKLLDYSESKKIVFKAPTGSGKTIMIAEFLKKLVTDSDKKKALSFIWAAPRPVLTNQSKEKLESYFESSRALRCSFFEDLEDKKIDEDEILFFNWESINKENNVYIRDNEQDFNLTSIIEHTKEEGREVVMIIDESHHHASSDISQRLINDIGPTLTIDVSATPTIKGDQEVHVDIEDVKKEGMIKKAVVLNEDFDNILEKDKIKTKLAKGSDEVVIEQAIKKRDELIKAYKKEGKNINPLVLIQLPDRTGSLEDRARERVISILKDKYKISTENGKLAIWLSGEHVNKENVEKHDSEVEVLLFKQAIALGWDCPRAQILVLFREWHSAIFSIQTIGRIMRMPEPDSGHYSEDILNYGYVYTNLDDIEIKDDLAKGYVTIYTSHRIKEYKPINLLSYYPKRHREKTRLSPLFTEIFLEEAKNYELKNKIDLKDKKLDVSIIADWKADNIDLIVGQELEANTSMVANNFDLQRLFDFFVRNHLTPFYPEDRSVGRVKESIYNFFEEEFEMDYSDSWEEIVKIVLSDSNSKHFLVVLNNTKIKYQEEVLKKRAELEKKEDWNIPKNPLNYNERFIKREDVKKSVMMPFFSDEKWQPEKEFILELEKSKSVSWWFKNGDRDATFFAIPYMKDGEQTPFYVDFIIMFNDGRIGLFDTKAGSTAKPEYAGPKAEALSRYIKEENKKGKKLFGGIIMQDNNKLWRYNNKEHYSWINDRSEDWELFDEFGQKKMVSKDSAEEKYRKT
jgi:type III restriction enzyme